MKYTMDHGVERFTNRRIVLVIDHWRRTIRVYGKARAVRSYKYETRNFTRLQRLSYGRV